MTADLRAPIGQITQEASSISRLGQWTRTSDARTTMGYVLWKRPLEAETRERNQVCRGRQKGDVTEAIA